MIEVKGPDGAVFRFPEGTPQSEMRSAMQKRYGAPEPKRPLSDMSLSGFGGMVGNAVVDAAGQTARRADDVVRSMASGATFGYADEIAAKANELLGIGDYETNVAIERGRDESIPLSVAIPGEVAGGLGTALVAAPAAAAAVPGRVAQAASKVPNIFKAMSAGGLYGGLYGSGAATEGNRVPGALLGAGLGAGTGGLLSAGGAGIGAARRGLERRFSPAAAAERQIIEGLTQGGMTPAKAAGRLDRLGPKATLADVGGENVRGLARASAGVPGTGKEAARTTLNMRAQGEGARLNRTISENLSPDNLLAEQDRAIATLRNNAQGLYDDAYRAGRALESKNLTRILNRPVIQDAMKEAADLAAIEGRRVSQLAPDLTAQAKEAVKLGLLDPSAVPKGGIGRGVTTEAIDDLKRGLDALIEREKNALTGGLSKRGKALNDLKREMLAEVDRLNPAYAAARAQYAGDAEVAQAIDAGTKILRQSPDAIRRDLAGMSAASQEAYRVGASNAMRDVVNKTGDTNSAARKLFGNSLTRQRLQAVFPDQQSYLNMARSLLGETVFNQTRNMILGGSQTAPRLAEQQALSGPFGAAMDAAGGGGTGNIVAKMASDAFKAVTAPNPRLAGELGSRLFAQGPAAQNVLQSLMQQSSQRQAVAPAQQEALRILNRAIAQQEGTRAGGLFGR